MRKPLTVGMRQLDWTEPAQGKIALLLDQISKNRFPHHEKFSDEMREVEMHVISEFGGVFSLLERSEEFGIHTYDLWLKKAQIKSYRIPSIFR